MAIQAPIDALTHRVLRAAVLELREGERRRRFPSTLHLGLPGTSVTHMDASRGLDAGLRADVVLALLQSVQRETPRHYAWLTRPGVLSLHDDDVPWASTLRWVAAATGRDLGLVVVTRQGWFDPESGVRREWRRLRRRSMDGEAQSHV